ncbi:MAG: alkyl sulfatase dimerization domain-containing protein, partial [bacterium]
TLIPLSPTDSAPLYVEMMGGAEKIITKGHQLVDQGDYLRASEILNKLVYAEPHHQEAKDLLADTFEQIGYQKESPSVRNSFLAAAFELRNGFPQGVAAQPVNPDLVVAMSTELFLDFLAIQVDSKKAEGLHFTLNLH